MKVTFRNRNFTSLWIAGLVSLIGALLIAQIGQRFSTAQLTTGGLVLSGAFLLVIATMPKLAGRADHAALARHTTDGLDREFADDLQQATTDEYRGRIFGTVSSRLMVFGFGAGRDLGVPSHRSPQT